MSASSSTVTIGPPSTGTFQAGDQFTDALGSIFRCARTGSPGLWNAQTALGSLAIPANEIVFGTGPSIGSSPNLTYEEAGPNAGRLFINTLTGTTPIGSVSTTQATPAKVAIYGVTGVQASNAQGGDVDIWGGYGTVAGGTTRGGDVNIWGGNTGGGPTAIGGCVNIFGGDSAGVGGMVEIIGGGTGATGGAITIDGGPGAAQGGTVTIEGGTGASFAGLLTLRGGPSSGAGQGGGVLIEAGAAGTANNGALVQITGGVSGLTTGLGGAVLIDGGISGTVSGTGGDVQTRGGAGQGIGDGGTVFITGGQSGPGATGNGGDVRIGSGSPTSTSGDGGNVEITAREASGAGTDGGIRFLTGVGSTERFEIRGDGAWELAGVVGAAGLRLTSNGAGLPPTWQA